MFSKANRTSTADGQLETARGQVAVPCGDAVVTSSRGARVEARDEVKTGNMAWLRRRLYVR